jgi:hypothetical protein
MSAFVIFLVVGAVGVDEDEADLEIWGDLRGECR